jgi:uncharacterized membrane protein YcaP (DUF421 family)
MFHLGLPLAEKILRPIIVYIALILFLRVFGKRELAQLNPFDLVVLLSLSNVVQNALIGDDNTITGGLIGAFTLLAINWLTVRMLYYRPKLDASRVLIENGLVCEDALKAELMTKTELMVVAHRQGFEQFDDIDRCVIEPGGTFAMYHKRPTDDEKQFAAVMAKLEELTAEVRALKGSAA